VLIRYLREKGLNKNLVVVSPDVGGVKMARAYSDALGAQLAIVAKHRVSATEVEAINVIGEVAGRDVLLVDDMTETAGTLTAAARILKERGAGRIYAGVSHAILNELALKRLEASAIEELICTDSVPMARGPKVTALEVAPLLASAIERINNGESVTSLFHV
jgi:ribose-phosphate pyrophosphokinase